MGGSGWWVVVGSGNFCVTVTDKDYCNDCLLPCNDCLLPCNDCLLPCNDCLMPYNDCLMPCNRMHSFMLVLCRITLRDALLTCQLIGV